jgi:hypothetical protein
MPRIRGLRPEYFLDEDLATLPYKARILYAGLWCHDDREGRLEYRPNYLTIHLFPYDEVDFENMLLLLAHPNIPGRREKAFIRIYRVGEKQYIDIPTFLKHQAPHHMERKSVLPAFPGSFPVTCGGKEGE